jgi:hypothetical protein
VAAERLGALAYAAAVGAVGAVGMGGLAARACDARGTGPATARIICARTFGPFATGATLAWNTTVVPDAKRATADPSATGWPSAAITPAVGSRVTSGGQRPPAAGDSARIARPQSPALARGPGVVARRRV